MTDRIPENAARNKIVYLQRMKGMTFEAIGASQGISKQRAFQIFFKVSRKLKKAKQQL